MNAVAPENISGLIERVTFFNEESGFCVLKKLGQVTDKRAARYRQQSILRRRR
jgi:hypothetical protein